MNTPSKYLFLVTVGPVQEFIASARDSHDLRSGFYLLSELSRAAAETIMAASFEGVLISPAPSESGLLDLPDVPNHILAVISSSSSPRELGATVTSAVTARMAALREKAFNLVRWVEEHPELRELAVRQVEELVEVLWVAVPLSDNYQKSRDRLEALMMARKRTQNFGPSPAPSNLRQPKSSIDGSRESVIPESLYPTVSDTRQQRQQKIANLDYRYRVGPGERLSGVDLVKRHVLSLQNGMRTPSSSHFAALPFLERTSAINTDFKRALENYRSQLQSAGVKLKRIEERYSRPLIDSFDASIFFDSRFAEQVDQAETATLQVYLRDFFAATTAGQYPYSYYALLYADGDNLGLAIDAQNTMEAHKEISRALNSFSITARRIIEEEQTGAVIYAAGDDILALLPLHTALACAKSLASAFSVVGASLRNNSNQTPTLSVGVVVLHHLEPFTVALGLAHEAISFAKRTDGRGALAIVLSERSGISHRVRGRLNNNFLSRLETFITWYRQELIPEGVAFELRDLYIRLAGHQGEPLNSILQEAIAEEAVRIFKRKRGLWGTTMLEANMVAYLRAQLGLAPEYTNNSPAPSHVDRIGVDVLADELIVAREFAHASGVLRTTESKT